MDAQQRERGIPTHWNHYIAVASTDDATAKAQSLGGTAMMAPFDVMDVGRMSIIKDPTGAMFCPWEPKKHFGAQLYGEVGTFCWFELNTNDPDASKEFYTKLFGWEIGGDANYTEWKSGGVSIGGMMKIQAEWGEVPPHWLGYVMVENVNESVEKAKALGGKVYVEPQDIPNMGRFAILADAQDGGFALYQPLAK